MITSADIFRRANRHFFDWLKALVDHAIEFPPLVIKYTGDARTVDGQRLDNLDELIAQSKTKIGYGYQIELDTPSHRSFNRQSRIKAIVFDTPDDLIRYIDRQQDFADFKASLALILNDAPYLRAWCLENVREIIRYTKEWPSLLAVLCFFQENPTPGLPLRLLPIPGVDTKFIEQQNTILCSVMDASFPAEHIDHNFRSFARRYQLPTQEPFVECYFNDSSLKKYFHGFTSVAFPADQLARLPLPGNRVVIVENRTSVQQLLQLPLPGTVIIFGCGFGVALLKNVTWLDKVELYYWGDVDTHGLAILSQVRGYFPHVQPILMDSKTLEEHQHLVVPDKPFRGSLPEYLTEDEQNLFLVLQRSSQRLEQERLSKPFLETRLLTLFLLSPMS